jgi:adenylate cyclase
VFTPLAALAANLRDSAKIRAILQLEEYFELINDIWNTLAPIFRQYRGTCGKHVGDGIRGFFLPQPDSSYMSNAAECAREMQRAMSKLDARWQGRNPGLDELALNIDLREQQEWLAALQSAGDGEFAPRRNVPNRPSHSGDAVGTDSLRAIKALGTKLMARERARSSAHRAAPAEHEFQWEGAAAIQAKRSAA